MPDVDSQSHSNRPLVHRGEPIRAPAGNASSVRIPPSQHSAEVRLALTDPAVHVVTDFAWEAPVTVPEGLPIDDALREMIRAGVRALLVVQDERVTGLITSYDIQGERPLQFLRQSGYRRHDEIEVGHIMTPRGSPFQHSIGGRSATRESRIWSRSSSPRRRPTS
jgi:hypothetical protein